MMLSALVFATVALASALVWQVAAGDAGGVWFFGSLTGLFVFASVQEWWTQRQSRAARCAAKVGAK